jgi:hypothetical protein
MPNASPFLECPALPIQRVVLGGLWKCVGPPILRTGKILRKTGYCVENAKSTLPGLPKTTL